MGDSMKDSHAVVVGGSIAGLLAAAAAAKHLQRVTVLDRDPLPDEPVVRKGAPQGSQAHVLLPPGERKIEELLPGISDELIAAGCVRYNHTADIPTLGSWGWHPRMQLRETEALGFRRPLLEHVIRRRLRGQENVEIRQGTVAGLLADEAKENLVGVGLKGGEAVLGDLVIDAGGRGSKSSKWLRSLGFEAPELVEVRVHLGYATEFVEFAPGVLGDGTKGILMPARVTLPRGFAILPADNGVYTLVANGFSRHYPPRDREGVAEFLEGAPLPMFAELVRQARPVSDLTTYRMPGSMRRVWEGIESPPGRFCAIGDAVASLNPVYGQGVTMAAFGARHLDDALGADGATLDSAPGSFQRALAGDVDYAFAVSAGGDVRYPGAELENFAHPSPEEVEFLNGLEQLAPRDAAITQAIAEATFGMRPEALQDEAIAARVAARPRDEQPPVDPGDYSTEVLPEPSLTGPNERNSDD
ncbi:MAG: FAD-dependent monooxygenase [Actinobacteria bacterium]|nr:FAD-dependent monooxygenase [Actinomycetota bacterium]